MKNSAISEHLVRLAYTDIVLHHAEVDSASEFVKNVQDDLGIIDDPGPSGDIKNLTDNSGLMEDAEKPSARRGLISRFLGSKMAPVLAAASLLFFVPFLLLLIFTNIKYNNKIFPGTEYSSVELDSDPQKALKQIEDISGNYKITLKFSGAEKSYPASDMGLTLNPEETLATAKEQSSKINFFAKPLEIFRHRYIKTSVHIDDDKVRAFLTSQNYSDKLPEDAKIEYSPDKNQFVAIPEISGRGIDSSSFKSKIETSAKELKKEAIDLEIEDVKPKIISANLSRPLSEANQYLGQKITISSSLKNYITTPQIIKDWIELVPNRDQGTYLVSFKEDSLNKYVDSIVKKINHKMEKKLYASIGGSELLLQEGSPGIEVSNTSNIKKELLNNFKAKNGGVIKVEAKEEAPTTENVAASGGRWILADLSQYRLYAYEGATLANSFPMSSGKASTPTPTGRYSVMSKVRVKTMRGGTPGRADYYSVPNIEWIAYFKAGGYAMHGVYWHNKFGIENTSHGCMGMSNTNAKWVYDFVEVGTPVIIVP